MDKLIIVRDPSADLKQTPQSSSPPKKQNPFLERIETILEKIQPILNQVMS